MYAIHPQVYARLNEKPKLTEIVSIALFISKKVLKALTIGCNDIWIGKIPKILLSTSCKISYESIIFLIQWYYSKVKVAIENQVRLTMIVPAADAALAVAYSPT